MKEREGGTGRKGKRRRQYIHAVHSASACLWSQRLDLGPAAKGGREASSWPRAGSISFRVGAVCSNQNRPVCLEGFAAHAMHHVWTFRIIDILAPFWLTKLST